VKSSCLQNVRVLVSLLNMFRGDIMEQEKMDSSRMQQYDLDYDLELLLPSDKLVSIGGGWDQGELLVSARTGVLFFNLGHEHALTVAQLWSESLQGVACDKGNEFQILLQVLRSVANEDTDKLQSMVYGLVENDNGFIVKDHGIIKSISASVATPKYTALLADTPGYRAAIQATADAVCYRYYPKCEVI
jgi:hypothetical protein